MSSFVTGVDG